MSTSLTCLLILYVVDSLAETGSLSVYELIIVVWLA